MFSRKHNVYSNNQKSLFLYYLGMNLMCSATYARHAGIAERTAQKWAKRLKEDPEWGHQYSFRPFTSLNTRSNKLAAIDKVFYWLTIRTIQSTKVFAFDKGPLVSDFKAKYYLFISWDDKLVFFTVVKWFHDPKSNLLSICLLDPFFVLATNRNLISNVIYSLLLNVPFQDLKICYDG